MKHEARCWAVCLTCDVDGLTQSDTLGLAFPCAAEKTHYLGRAEDWSVRQAQPFSLKVHLTLILEMYNEEGMEADVDHGRNEDKGWKSGGRKVDDDE